MTKANGELISIDDSAYDGFKGMTIYGKTVQNLWVNPSGTQRGVTVTSNADGSITVSGTATYAAYITAQSYALRPGTQYTLSVDKSTNARGFYVDVYNADNQSIQVVYIGGSQGALLSRTFTLNSNAVRVSFGFGVESGTTLSGTYRVMLNEGSTAEPWCPPGLNSVGDDGSVKIVTAGKNLLQPVQSGNTTQGVTLTVDSAKQTFSVHGTNTGASFAIFNSLSTGNINSAARAGRLKIVTNIPTTGDLYFQVNDADLDGTNAGSIARYGNGSNQTLIDLPTTRRIYEIFLGVNVRGTVNLDGRWVAIVPEEYSGEEHPLYVDISSSTIDLQGHTLNALPNGKRDELHIDGGGNVVLEKRTGIATAPTSEGSWTFEAKYGRGYFDIFPNAYGTAGEGALLCDKLPPREAGASPTEGTYSLAAASSGYARVSTADALSELVPIAGGATYIYPRAKPQTIDLGKIDLPKLRKKPLVNNIWANGTASGTGFSLAPEIDYEYNQWSTYCDGFRTHGKHSYFDMGCCIAARDTGTPEKKSVTATVPYMSGFYDLSKLYGAIAFEARQLMYRFEFVEDSRDELQRKKSQFLEWLSQVHDEEIADDDIPGRHFIGSLSEWEFEEGEEGQSGSLEVTFNCQPFMEADEDTTKTCNAGSNTVTVNGQAVNVYAKTSSGTATIRIGGVTQSVGTTEIRLSVQLQPGDNAVTITGSPVTLRWRELTV